MAWYFAKKRLLLIVTIFIIFTSFYSSFSNVSAINLNDEVQGVNKVAIFYGSEHDYRLCQDMIIDIEISTEFYNISSVLLNSSFIFDNESFEAIWWVNELPLPIDLSFVGDIHSWISSGKGLFVLSKYFENTPLVELDQLGIESYWPEIYPLSGSSTNQQIQLNNDTLASLELEQFLYDFDGSSSWVQLKDEVKFIAEIPQPEELPYLNDFTSGLWLAHDKVIVGSFTIDFENTLQDMLFSLLEIQEPTNTDLIAILGEIAVLTTEFISSPGGIFEFSGVEQLATVALVSLASIISIIGLMKFGILSRLREIITSLLIGGFMAIAHIAYSPQKRRISEDDLLDNEMRMQIVDYLQEKGEQGAHLREIQRIIGCGISSLLWHLQALDDFNLVTHHKIGKYHIFYLTGVESLKTTEIALALKSDVAKDLCRVLMKKMKPISLSRISSEIEVHHSSVQHHIKKLSDIGVIVVLKEKKRSSYIINPNRVESLTKLLKVN
ncbi:MAG: hypothetical protein ACXAB2_06460 [Candidatus Hodarchaeales archaeon]|jgi:predicted transcriptional regulator